MRRVQTIWLPGDRDDTYLDRAARRAISRDNRYNEEEYRVITLVFTCRRYRSMYPRSWECTSTHPCIFCEEIS